MRSWLIGASLLLLLGGVGWGVSDRLEQRNDFCNACHLPDGTALHLATRENFDRVIAVDLAGLHGRGWVEEREASAFRCIDCHAGSAPLERTLVKLLSLRDGLRYAIGDFEEPEGMAFDLSPQTCLGCHPSFRHAAAPGWTLAAYHGPDHEGPTAPGCVGCHVVHEEDGDAFAYFLNRSRVDRQCRECHAPGGEMAIPSLLRRSGSSAASGDRR